MWPSGRAPVFGTVDRRFESYHPSQLSFRSAEQAVGLPKGPLNAPVYAPAIWPSVKWSGKFGQRAKVYPTRTNGYENDKVTELFRQFQSYCGA